MKALDLRAVGGNYANIKKYLQKLQIDTSHWTGQGWCKDQQLKDWSNYARNKQIKKHLIKLRGHQCEECKLDTWLNLPITLELEHIDGDRTNNVLLNFKLLCPNCHSQTPTWRRKKSSLA